MGAGLVGAKLGLAAAIVTLALGLGAGSATAQSRSQAPNVQSLSQGRNGPINIVSDSLELRDKDKTATFINNVKLVQGDTMLECKVLVVHYDADGKGPARALGGGGSGDQQQIKKLEAKGAVILTQKDQIATGDNGVFDVKSNVLVLTGNVVLTQGQNVIKGDRLWVDLTTNVSRVESSKAVQGLILPNAADSKPPQTAPAPVPIPTPRAGATTSTNTSGQAGRGAQNAAPERDRQRSSAPLPLRN